MGLFSSDDESGDVTFKPVTTDGNLVLGYLDNPEEDGKRLVWIADSKFDRLSSDEADQIDRIVE
jgi:hypothetical protein